MSLFKNAEVIAHHGNNKCTCDLAPGSSTVSPMDVFVQEETSPKQASSEINTPTSPDEKTTKSAETEPVAQTGIKAKMRPTISLYDCSPALQSILKEPNYFPKSPGVAPKSNAMVPP